MSTARSASAPRSSSPLDIRILSAFARSITNSSSVSQAGMSSVTSPPAAYRPRILGCGPRPSNVYDWPGKPERYAPRGSPPVPTLARPMSFSLWLHVCSGMLPVYLTALGLPPTSCVRCWRAGSRLDRTAPTGLSGGLPSESRGDVPVPHVP